MGDIKANKVMPTCGKVGKNRLSLCYVHTYLCVCTFSLRYSLLFESCFLYTVNMQNVIVTVFAIFSELSQTDLSKVVCSNTFIACEWKLIRRRSTETKTPKC